MRIALVAPSSIPPVRGGAERAVDGLGDAIEQLTPHACDVVRVPVDESSLPGLVAGYRAFAALDLLEYDRIVSVKYPAWMVGHPRHTVLMFHPLRGLYDTYHLFKLPLEARPASPELRDLQHLITHRADRPALDEFFGAFTAAVGRLGPTHPDLAFPGPIARQFVHWLDHVALASGQVEKHLALSRTVAARADYFPEGIVPGVAYLPSDLPFQEPGTPRHVFTASRLDAPKRLDLLVQAYRRVPGDVPLSIAGTGPEDRRLRQLAAGDDRIQFSGYVPDDVLADMYRSALAVPFLPYDEDYGLVTLEAFSAGAPVVTFRDSGGPTELVADGVSGFVVDPTVDALADALTRIVGNPALARKMGRAGQRRAARVTWSGAIQRILGEDGRLRPPPAHAHRELPQGRSWADLRLAAGRAADAIPASEPADGAPAVVGRARPKVVALATFRIDQPRGGGQLRCRHLYGALARHADVEVLSLVDHTDGGSSRVMAPGFTQTTIPRSPAQAAAGHDLSGEARMPVTDIVAGTHIWANPGYLDALRDRTRDADVVILAEPYLQPALGEAGIDLPYVYDAFNVEADLKAAALPDTPLGHRLLAQVEEVEAAATLGSAAITACSGVDADELARRYGRDRGAVTVIPNGTVVGPAELDPVARDRRARRWLARYAQTGLSGRRPSSLAVFFGSWHPPNLDAVRLLISVAPDLQDVLFLGVGSHGMYFADRTVPVNVVFPGVVTDRVKTALLGCATVAVNPMRAGSGTNLKLLEYLAAAVPVVSTPFGARGIDVVDGRDLLLAEPDQFGAALRRSLDDPAAARARAEAGRDLVAATYGWDALGDRLWSVVREVLGTSVPSPG